MAAPEVVALAAEASPQSHEITTLNASGEMFSADPISPIHHEATMLTPVAEPEVSGLPYEEELEEEDSQSFAPGSGDLQEELIDEEEYEIAALHAGYEDEMEELEEETLEGAADLGTMIREMSIDQITRSAPESDESELEEEDTEEDFIEESEQLQQSGGPDSEDDTEDAGSEAYARTAEGYGRLFERVPRAGRQWHRA